MICLTGIVNGKLKQLQSNYPKCHEFFVEDFKKWCEHEGINYELLWITDINHDPTIDDPFVVYDKSAKRFMAEGEYNWTYSAEGAQIYYRELLN